MPVAAWIKAAALAIKAWAAQHVVLATVAKVGAVLVLDAAVRKYTARDLETFRNPGREIMTRGSVEAAKIIYGEAACSGVIAYANVAGTDNADLYYAIVLAAHECDSFVGYYIENDYIDAADVSGTDGHVTTGSYGPSGGTNQLYLREHLGTAAQTVDSMLNSAFSTDITTNHRFRECAYVVARATLVSGSTLWDGGPPANIRVVVKGKKVYDPRLDSTFSGSWGTGSGAHRLNDPSTWEWSNCPALCVADYLIDATLGAGWDSSKVDYNSVAIAADDCDASVAVPTSSTENRFTCNGVLTTASSHEDNIKDLLSSMNGRLVYRGGVWHVLAGVYQSPTINLDEGSLRGDLQVRTQSEAGDRYNTVRGIYVDPERNYKDSNFLEVTSSSYTTRDNGETIYRDLVLPFTNSEYEAQRIAYKILWQCDEQIQVVFPANYSGLKVAVGDTVAVTIDEYGWSGKTFRCVGWKFGDFVGVDLILREDQSAAYDDPAEGDYGTRTAAGVVSFPTLTAPQAPTGLAASGDGAGVTLSWTNPDAGTFDYVEVWAASSNDRATASLAARVRGDTLVLTSDTSITRYFWIRALHEQRGVSAWEPTSSTAGVSATYGGATGPPGDPGTDAVSLYVVPEFGEWTYDPNAATYDPTATTCDITFLFKQGGSTIATHVIRITRSGSNLTGATQSESGEATTEDTSTGSGTPTITVSVTHDASGAAAAYTMSVRTDGVDGTDGIDGINGTNGAPGEDFWTPNLSSNMSASGKSYTKSAGSSGWNEQVYSSERYGGCIVQWEAHDATHALMMGLNTDPTTDANYTSIDHAIYLTASGGVNVYESGSNIGAFGTYAAGDSFAIVYDGTSVRYVHNGTVIRTVTNSAKKFYLDSSFYTVSAQVDNLSFIGGSSADVLTSLQAVISSLSAIEAEVGSLVISSTGGSIRSGQTAFDTGTGFWEGFVSSYPKLSIGNGTYKFTFDPSATPVAQLIADLQLGYVQTFTPSSWGGFASGSSPSGSLSYVNLGALAIIWCPADRIGTAHATDKTFTMSGIPSAIRPSATAYGRTIADVAYAQPVGSMFSVSSGGVMTLSEEGATSTWILGVANTWNNVSADKGFFAGTSFIYPLL